MAVLTVQSVSESGLAPTYATAGGSGDTFADDGTQRTFLHVKNGSGASINVTVAAQTTTRTVAGMGVMTKASAVVAVPAGTDRMIGPFPPDAYKNTSGVVSVTYSATATVTVAAIKLPQL